MQIGLQSIESVISQSRSDFSAINKGEMELMREKAQNMVKSTSGGPVLSEGFFTVLKACQYFRFNPLERSEKRGSTDEISRFFRNFAWKTQKDRKTFLEQVLPPELDIISVTESLFKGTVVDWRWRCEFRGGSY